jgi:hypothetical protein
MEKWVDIKGYNGVYQISSLGRVKTSKRKKARRSAGKPFTEERIHTQRLRLGYPVVRLSKNKKIKTYQIHRLVASHFISEIPKDFVVNHIDFNIKNNDVSNLEIVTRAQNSRHGRTNKKSSSKYIGVFFDKQTNMYRSQITHNRKVYNVGRFESELDAYEANKKKRKELGIETIYEESLL